MYLWLVITPKYSLVFTLVDTETNHYCSAAINCLRTSSLKRRKKKRDQLPMPSICQLSQGDHLLKEVQSLMISCQQSHTALLKLGTNRILSKVHSTRSQDVTMMSKGLNSGILVSPASGVVERNCWMKQQSNTRIQRHLWLSKLAVWVLCMGNRA